jgi:outer membrane protein
MVNSQVKQAQYNFVGASEQLESAHRSVVQTVRSSFNNVNASISSINAYKQAVVSAQSSLDAMEAGYSVGTRTIVDVLDATTTLYNAKQQLSSARYNYLINQLNIKSGAGYAERAGSADAEQHAGQTGLDLAGQRRAGNPQQDAALITSTQQQHPCGTAGAARTTPPAAAAIRSVSNQTRDAFAFPRRGANHIRQRKDPLIPPLFASFSTTHPLS